MITDFVLGGLRPKAIVNTSNVPRIDYEYGTVLPFEQGLDYEWALGVWTNYWHYSIYLSLIYFALVYALSVWMRSRKAFVLRLPLMIWNGALAIFSIAGLIRSSEEFFATLSLPNGFYKSICYTFPPQSVAAYWFLFFAFSKVAEMGDTVFLVLRKRKLTFLHCYHHAAVLVYCFHSGVESMAAGRWFIVMNFFAHSLMYSYYTLMSIGVKVPRRLAASVTTVQIAQMLAGVLVSIAVLYIKSSTDWTCQQSSANLSLCFGIYASFAVLFIRFFVNAYLRTPPSAEKTAKSKEQ